MQKIYLLSILALLSACVAHWNKPSASVSTSEAGHKVANDKYRFSIQYYADYWFHGLSKKKTLNRDEQFVNLPSVKKAHLAYYAHTITEPYCSTLGLIYPDKPVKQIVPVIINELKSRHALNLLSNEQLVGLNNFTKISYELTHADLRITVKYLEYICPVESHTFRIIFWTTEAGDNWLQEEAQAVVSSLQTP